MRSAQQVAAVLTALSFLSVIALALSMIHISKMVSLKSIGGIVGSTILTHRLCSQSNNVNCKPLHMSTATVDHAAQAGLSNPLLAKHSTPLFGELKAEHILPAVEFDLDKLKQDFTDLESIFREPQHGEAWGKRRVEYDYETVIESMEKIQAPLSYSWGAVGHLMGVKNSEELRKAHDALQPRVIEINQQIGQSQLLYHALNALKRQYVWSSLDETQHRIVDSALRSMQASGVGITDPATKAQFNKLQLEQAELSTKFSNNVLDSTKLFKLRLTEKEDVDGLPLSSKALAAQQAIASGDAGATADEGPWVFTLDMPSYLPCMQHLRKRDLREQLYRAYVTRASTLEHDNAPIIRRILQIKLDLARMLGYNCFAEKSLSKKMASSVDSVMALNEMLRERAMPAAVRELQQLEQFAQQSSSSRSSSGGGQVEVEESLALWDVPFWSERLREQQYQYQEEELRPYFALPNVLDGLFSLATRLFGVVIEAADGEAQVWHPDVRYFRIKEESTGDVIAYFYLDPYSRPSEKRGGAWMDVCLGRSKVMHRIPVAYLTCNGSPPVGDKPSLMTFREVETMFHEFGHGLQHMLTRVEHADAAGINNVEWDAVELPSQFMENWCYDKPTLYAFAKHYETGAPLPEELFEKVKAAKNFQAGMGMIRQLYFGAMDMYLHSTQYDPHGEVTPFQIQHQLASKFTVIPPLAEDRFLCSFGHIFAGGYSAGYYSYKWAEVMSADAFAAFEEVGLDNEEAVKTTGRRFRDTVLGLGGGKHPSDVFKAFRGRDPSPEALLRHSGLVTTAQTATQE